MTGNLSGKTVNLLKRSSVNCQTQFGGYDELSNSNSTIRAECNILKCKIKLQNTFRTDEVAIRG